MHVQDLSRTDECQNTRAEFQRSSYSFCVNFAKIILVMKVIGNRLEIEKSGRMRQAVCNSV